MGKVNGSSRSGGRPASDALPASDQGRVVFAPYGPGTEGTPYAVLRAQANGDNVCVACAQSRELAARIANGR